MYLFGNTDIGKRRQNNQDSFFTKQYDDPGIALALVCDGMGGANGGNIASTLAGEAFLHRVDSFVESIKFKHRSVTEGDISSMLAHAVSDANAAVYRRASEEKSLQGMGTTLVAALSIDNILYIVNVGDSRLYLYADGRLLQITRDHSLVQYLIDTGKITAAEAKDYPSRNVITRAVGTERSLEADIFSFDMSTVENDPMACALLCSDGLSSYVEESFICDVLKTECDRANVPDALISAANEAGGVDNITVVLMTFAQEMYENDGDEERDS